MHQILTSTFDLASARISAVSSCGEHTQGVMIEEHGPLILKVKNFDDIVTIDQITQPTLMGGAQVSSSISAHGG